MLQTIKPLFFASILALFMLVAMPLPVQSKVFINEKLIRLEPAVSFKLKPSDLKRFLLIARNKDEVDSIISVHFKEEQNYFGFAALICDEENAKLYVEREKSFCKRYEVNSSKNKIRFAADGSKTYYMFVITRNKSIRLYKNKPVGINRFVDAESYVTVIPNDSFKEQTEAFLERIMSDLVERHDIEPLNFAVAPCSNRYIPSSYEKRLITLCSELVLGPDLVPDKALLLGTLFYELVPFLVKDWDLSLLEGEGERIDFAQSLLMTFIDNPNPLDAVFESNNAKPHAYPIIKQGELDGEYSYKERVRRLADFAAEPYKRGDKWLNIIYNNMTKKSLNNIRDGKLKHYGVLRNTARLVLKRRFEDEEN